VNNPEIVLVALGDNPGVIAGTTYVPPVAWKLPFTVFLLYSVILKLLITTALCGDTDSENTIELLPSVYTINGAIGGPPVT
jgi:membrane protein implicated in regulation of membrane protease activity